MSFQLRLPLGRVEYFSPGNRVNYKRSFCSIGPGVGRLLFFRLLIEARLSSNSGLHGGMIFIYGRLKLPLFVRLHSKNCEICKREIYIHNLKYEVACAPRKEAEQTKYANAKFSPRFSYDKERSRTNFLHFGIIYSNFVPLI